MAKILDLDELETPEFALKLGGKEHVMNELTVEDFIQNTRELAKLRESTDEAEHFEAYVRMIGRMFPTIQKEDLMKLKLSQLGRIMQWIQEEAARGAEDRDPKKETATTTK